MEKLNENYIDNSFQNFTLLILRIIIATIFLFAGIAKWPFWTTPIAGTSEAMINLIKFLSVVEPLAAIALAVGFLTRWAAFGTAIIMLGAIWVLKFNMQVSFFTQPQSSGWDYNLIILGGVLALMAFGAGKWSIDNILRRD